MCTCIYIYVRERCVCVYIYTHRYTHLHGCAVMLLSLLFSYLGAPPVMFYCTRRRDWHKNISQGNTLRCCQHTRVSFSAQSCCVCRKNCCGGAGPPKEATSNCGPSGASYSSARAHTFLNLSEARPPKLIHGVFVSQTVGLKRIAVGELRAP